MYYIFGDIGGGKIYVGEVSYFCSRETNYMTIITFHCFSSLVELTEVTYYIFGDIAEVLGFCRSLQNYNKFVKLRANESNG